LLSTFSANWPALSFSALGQPFCFDVLWLQQTAPRKSGRAPPRLTLMATEAHRFGGAGKLEQALEALAA
jgi:hypothetical protein